MPPLKERIRGEYENKIRRSSPPEKIFECFATIPMDGSIYMSHSDLFQAIVPYNYSTTMEQKEELLKGYESAAIMKFADANNDGKISLYEYYFFVIFM